MKLVYYYYIINSIFNDFLAEPLTNFNDVLFIPDRVKREVVNMAPAKEYETYVNAYKKFLNNIHICKVERKSERVCKKYRLISDRTMLIIAGGREAQDEEFPHMVALGFHTEEGYKFGCGGSLISPTYVLTAAHCVQNTQKMRLDIVRIGTTFVPQFESNLTTFDVKVKKTICHPEYNRTTKIHDIALIELHQSVKFGKTVKPVCLYPRDDDPQFMEIVGWGENNFAGEITPRLRKAVLPRVPKCDCEKLYARRLKLKIQPCHICAGNHNVNICKGDSGGPLLVRNQDAVYLVGVVVHGEKCGTNTPGVFARVSSYLDWIEKIVWNDEH